MAKKNMAGPIKLDVDYRHVITDPIENAYFNLYLGIIEMAISDYVTMKRNHKERLGDTTLAITTRYIRDVASSVGTQEMTHRLFQRLNAIANDNKNIPMHRLDTSS